MVNRIYLAGATAFIILCGCAMASAETMESTLIQAYQSNPQLNAQRASVRSTDEDVPQALSGYRPHVAVTASGGYQYGTENETVIGNPTVIFSGAQRPRTVGATVTQTLFNGDQTANHTRAAEGQVSASREGLRVLDQTILLSAATVYMDYLRDAAILDVNRSNVHVLEQTLGQTRERFKVGDVTRTDVAQSGAQLAAGRSQLQTAESNLTTTRANFGRIVGSDPQNPAAASPVDRLLPKTLVEAVDVGLTQNPNVTAAMFGIDVSFLQVKVNEGALFPTVTVQANVQQAYEPALTIDRQFNAAAIAQISVPIYQGGAEYALIRQSKETLAQQRLSLEQVRKQTRAGIISAWGQLLAGKSQVNSAQEQVSESETALNGVRDEARVGQRTTLDVLNAQQALVNARVALVTAQHDRVVASYAVLSAVGRLSPTVLGLNTTVYDPSVHYHQVRDSWGGIRTPDGR
jgi:outer membrane protein